MDLLRSKEATLSVLVIALIAQIPHAAYVFTHIGKQQETWFSFGHGGAYAIALELAVLLFVVRNRQVESYGFAAVSILINLSYYNMHGVSVFSLGSFPAWLVSVALPVAIACYSHDIAHETVGADDSVKRLNYVQIDSTTVQLPEAKQIEQVAQSVKPRTEQEATFWNMLNDGIEYKVTVLARELNIAPNTLRSWRERWESVQQELRTP